MMLTVHLNIRTLNLFSFVIGQALLADKIIPARWLKPAQNRSVHEEISSNIPRQVNVRNTSLPSRALDQSERFRKARDITSELTELASVTGGKQYDGRIKVLTDIIKFWNSKQECVVLPITSAGIVDGQYFIIL